MDQRSTWVGADAPSKKIQHIALQRTNDKMDAAAKEGVKLWNLMVNTLRDNGLMEEK
ncbi:hypothetical protein KIH86_23925 [Paenibacillus sp. HN-1]|uniref:hypothetical protein n=1 Tax=Paenibacillus TaxID=44249 RepID=UPI001CA8739C|nr:MULTISPECIES: hypothetical protein [Paenibacillus]MBY9081200.1 hypothetical protein [Paenibacillus sp. CGMCC 1.18879]MBY9087237.1 hypothetical protein [Paenibacillus sinensis]